MYKVSGDVPSVLVGCEESQEITKAFREREAPTPGHVIFNLVQAEIRNTIYRWT